MKKRQNKANIEKLNILPCENSLRTQLLGMICAGFFAAGFGLSDMRLSSSISPLTVALCIAAAVIFKALSCTKPLKKLYPLIPAAAGAVILLLFWSDFIGGCGEIANVLINRWNVKYSDAITLFETDHSSAVFDLAVVFITAALADALTLAEKPYVSVILSIAYTIPFLIASSFSPVAAACLISAVIVQQTVACDNNFDVKKAVWLTSVAAVVLTASLTLGKQDISSVDDLRDDAKTAVERIRYGGDTLPKGDLSKAHLMNKGSEEALEVTQSVPKTLYLKGFVGADYSEGKWTELSRAHFRGENEGIDKWLTEQDQTPSMQYSRYLAAGSTSFDDNTVKIKNIGADRRYVYLPYSVRNVSCSQHAERDSAVLSEKLFGAKNYSFTENSDIYPGELLYPKEWVLDPQTDAQQTYSEKESVYRSFVYKSYLDMSEELEINFKKIFVDTFDTNDDVNVYNVTQHIHKVLESCAYYSEEPDRTAAEEPMKEFLNGKAGNSAMYATAAVLAYRSFGIPARYAEGYFIDGTAAKDNTAVKLTSKNAHAWAEVYIDGLGWVPIDVTPGYYYDAYTLMEMVQKPQNVTKTAALEDDPDQADPIQQKGRQQDAQGSLKKTVINAAMMLLGIAALAIILIVLAAVFLEVRTAVLVNRFNSRYQQADEAKKQQLICVALPTLLKCIGVEMNLGWNAQDTEKELRERYAEIYEGEYIKVNQLMEKCIYGEETLQAHELRVLSAFAEKLGNYKHSSLSFKEKLRLRYWRPPY